MHIDHKNNGILIFGEGPAQGLDDTTFYTTKFVLSLHYNGSSSFLSVNATDTYQFEVKNSQIKDYSLRLGNFSKDFITNNMKKETGLNGVIKLFSVDFNTIDTDDILNIHKYLMKGTWWKINFELIKKIFIGLLLNTVKNLTIWMIYLLKYVF